MHLNKVEITNFRNLISTSITPSTSLNLIHGDNGSGKSSLLEAIYFLTTGTSFRTHKISNIVHSDEDCLTLFTELNNGSIAHRLGIRRCVNESGTSRLDGRELSRRSELVELIPSQIISPESVALLLEGSEQRRNFLDWSLFHVEHTYHYHLSYYLRALKQRNAALREGALTNISIWDAQLIEHGEKITAFRSSVVDSLYPIITENVLSLLPELDLQMRYRQGWSHDHSLEEALASSRDNDIKMKHTTVGPHRADLVVRHMGSKASEVLSRGQLKLIVVALKLAQVIHLQGSTGKHPIILIDDLAAELDMDHRLLLLNTLLDLNCQLFVTTPDLTLIDSEQWKAKKVFHVEHGKVEEVV